MGSKKRSGKMRKDLTSKEVSYITELPLDFSQLALADYLEKDHAGRH